MNPFYDRVSFVLTWEGNSRVRAQPSTQPRCLSSLETDQDFRFARHSYFATPSTASWRDVKHLASIPNPLCCEKERK